MNNIIFVREISNTWSWLEHYFKKTLIVFLKINFVIKTFLKRRETQNKFLTYLENTFKEN